MNQRQQLWDVLKDLFGSGPGESTSGADTLLRAELSTCNQALEQAATQARASLAAANEAQQRLTDALTRTLALEEAGDTARAQALRESVAGLDSANQRAEASARSAHSRYEAVHHKRDALLAELRGRTPPAARRAAVSGRARAPGPAGDGADEQTAALRADLEALARSPHIADLAHRCVAQIDTLTAAAGSVTDMLGRRLNPDEITYQRYARAAASLVSVVTSNLDAAADRLRVLKALAPDGPASTLATPGSQSAAGATPSPAARARADRLALQAAQRSSVEHQIEANEAAITALLRTSAALAEMPVAGGADHGDFEGLVQDLNELAARARLFTTDA